MSSKGYLDISKLIQMQDKRQKKDEYCINNNLIDREFVLNNFDIDVELTNDIFNLNDKISKIKEILNNERISENDEDISNNENINEEKRKVFLDEEEIKLMFNRYNNIQNDTLKDDIDELFKKVLKREKIIEELEYAIAGKAGNINVSDYTMQLEIEKSLKMALRRELEEEIEIFLDNIEKRSNIAKNMYYILKNIESMKK